MAKKLLLSIIYYSASIIRHLSYGRKLRGTLPNQSGLDIDMARSPGEAATSTVWRNRIVDTLRRLIADRPDR